MNGIYAKGRGAFFNGGGGGNGKYSGGGGGANGGSGGDGGKQERKGENAAENYSLFEFILNHLTVKKPMYDAVTNIKKSYLVSFSLKKSFEYTLTIIIINNGITICIR
ncbi:hypothetical protein ES708_23927 [subsurface metagenome]